jgi:hypothetical protein
MGHREVGVRTGVRGDEVGAGTAGAGDQNVASVAGGGSLAVQVAFRGDLDQVVALVDDRLAECGTQGVGGPRRDHPAVDRTPPDGGVVRGQVVGGHRCWTAAVPLGV